MITRSPGGDPERGGGQFGVPETPMHIGRDSKEGDVPYVLLNFLGARSVPKVSDPRHDVMLQHEPTPGPRIFSDGSYPPPPPARYSPLPKKNRRGRKLREIKIACCAAADDRRRRAVNADGPPRPPRCAVLISAGFLRRPIRSWRRHSKRAQRSSSGHPRGAVPSMGRPRRNRFSRPALTPAAEAADVS